MHDMFDIFFFLIMYVYKYIVHILWFKKPMLMLVISMMRSHFELRLVLRGSAFWHVDVIDEREFSLLCNLSYKRTRCTTTCWAAAAVNAEWWFRYEDVARKFILRCSGSLNCSDELCFRGDCIEINDHISVWRCNLRSYPSLYELRWFSDKWIELWLNHTKKISIAFVVCMVYVRHLWLTRALVDKICRWGLHFTLLYYLFDLFAM